MKVCPKCGKVIGFNSYFGAYICDNCGWEDDSYNKARIRYYSQRTEKAIFTIHRRISKTTSEMSCSNVKN